MKHTLTPAETIMKLFLVHSLAKLSTVFTAFMLIYAISTGANLLPSASACEHLFTAHPVEPSCGAN
ncbi:MAG: hypothetical protein FD135_4096 [Comamonadaceae bacterium]|nr:MAG: hypothetical protein FD135_4096 [Comamonadaceae bacterium]